jgi:hypothetical protein
MWHLITIETLLLSGSSIFQHDDGCQLFPAEHSDHRPAMPFFQVARHLIGDMLSIDEGAVLAINNIRFGPAGTIRDQVY